MKGVTPYQTDKSRWRIRHGKCGRTVFTHELHKYRTPAFSMWYRIYDIHTDSHHFGSLLISNLSKMLKFTATLTAK